MFLPQGKVARVSFSFRTATATVVANPFFLLAQHGRIAAGDETPGFAIDRVLKDLGLAEALWAENAFAPPAAQAAIAVFRAAAEAGLEDRDMTALRRLLKAT